MPRRTARVDISHNQYWIRGNVFSTLEWHRAGSNGLADSLVAPGRRADPGDFAIVMTGTESGWITLTVDVLDRPPERLELAEWDEVVEISLTLPGSAPGIVTAGDFDDPEDETGGGRGDQLPDFTHARPGPLRIRVHARGRDEGQRVLLVDYGEDPVEEHLILVWPGPAASTVSHKWSDAYGAQVRSRSKSLC
ncbi:hypothetical protein AB4212_41005 [Streptomyces sp. 2MCAF27]